MQPIFYGCFLLQFSCYLFSVMFQTSKHVFFIVLDTICIDSISIVGIVEGERLQIESVIKLSKQTLDKTPW